jgi:hypothetical protein
VLMHNPRFTTARQVGNLKRSGSHSNAASAETGHPAVLKDQEFCLDQGIHLYGSIKSLQRNSDGALSFFAPKAK